jgi:multidrug transporter EmrE-like cation transporter
MSSRARRTGPRPYAAVAATIALTVYGQGVVKWRVNTSGRAPAGFEGQLRWVLDLLLDPWVWTAGAAVVLASLAWLAVLASLDLSVAYPLMSASFVLVLLLGRVAFGESLGAAKIGGVLLVVAGLVVGNRTGRNENERLRRAVGES